MQEQQQAGQGSHKGFRSTVSKKVAGNPTLRKPQGKRTLSTHSSHGMCIATLRDVVVSKSNYGSRLYPSAPSQEFRQECCVIRDSRSQGCLGNLRAYRQLEAFRNLLSH